MRIFLTGATGYVGSAVCDALRAAGHQISGLARNEEKAAALKAKGITPVLGDLRDAAVLKAAASAADGVAHIAMEWSAESGVVDRQAVTSMLDGLAGSGKPFVYTSGVWVMGDTGGRMNGEISAINPPPFIAWRPQVEDLVLEAGAKNIYGMVLRPGMVFGRGGGFVGGFFHDARTTGKVRVVGDGENHWSNVHVDDLADLYVRALGNPAKGEMFIACPGMPQPVKRIAQAVAEAAGVPGQVEYIPVAEAEQQMGPVAGCLAMDCKAGSTKATRYFAWAPKIPYIYDEIQKGSYGAA